MKKYGDLIIADSPKEAEALLDKIFLPLKILEEFSNWWGAHLFEDLDDAIGEYKAYLLEEYGKSELK